LLDTPWFLLLSGLFSYDRFKGLRGTVPRRTLLVMFYLARVASAASLHR
jgi:hypothetical protein